jgi:solute carrier family 35 protein E4
MVSSAQILKVCAVVSGYLVFNTSINLFNRWCLGMYGFAFPVVITVCHFSFAFFALTPMMLLVPAYRQQHRCV